jgi:DNA-binding HxlR family transcriptional regulator
MSLSSEHMPRKNDFFCPTEAALSVIGGKWKIIILCRLHHDVSRFNEPRRQIPDISQRMLTQHLRELERDGIVLRVAYSDGPLRVEYALTEFGKTLTPALETLYSWGTLYQPRLPGRGEVNKPRKALDPV